MTEKSSYATFWEMVSPLNEPPKMRHCLEMRRRGCTNLHIAQAYGVGEETIRLLVDYAWWLETEGKVWRDFEATGQQMDPAWWRRFREGWVNSLSEDGPIDPT